MKRILKLINTLNEKIQLLEKGAEQEKILALEDKRKAKYEELVDNVTNETFIDVNNNGGQF